MLSRTLHMLVLAVGLLLLMVGCSSAPSTLEEYYDAHPEEFEKQLSDYKSGLSSQDFASSDMRVEGNEIIMTGALTFNLSDLDAETKQYVTDTLTSFFKTENSSELVSSIRETEKQTGISGITITMHYTDKSGTEIASGTFDANGLV